MWFSSYASGHTDKRTTKQTYSSQYFAHLRFYGAPCISYTSSVVRECCKGDDESLWEMGIFELNETQVIARLLVIEDSQTWTILPPQPQPVLFPAVASLVSAPPLSESDRHRHRSSCTHCRVRRSWIPHSFLQVGACDYEDR